VSAGSFSVAWAVEAGLASALLMVVVLMVRGSVRRAFGPTVAYALWALPALRLVLPPLPIGWTRGWTSAAATPVSRAGEVVVAVIVQPAPAAIPSPGPVAAVATAAPGLSPAAVLVAVWALGASAFFAWAAIGYWRMRHELLTDHRPVDQIGRVRVVESAHAAGPMAFGVLDRVVVLPADLKERYDADERALALAHELGHHARGDLLANWAALMVLSVHWFNPLAWRAFRAFRADQELACDARVLAGRGRADRLVYACAIVKAAHGRAVTPACHLHTVEDLKGRLRMLKIDPASRRRLVAGTASVALMAAGSLALTASGTSAAAAVRAVQEVLPPAMPVTAAPVPAPAVPATVPNPPAAPAKPAKLSRRVTLVTERDGKQMVRTFAPGQPLPPEVTKRLATMPLVRSGECRTTDANRATEVVQEGGRRVTVICRRHIEAMAKRGEEVARRGAEAARFGEVMAHHGEVMARNGEALAAVMASEHALRAPLVRLDALRSARMNLRLARRNVETADMPEGARREAIAGIDEGLREIEENIREGK